MYVDKLVRTVSSFLQTTVSAGEPVEVQLRVSAELLSVTSCRELICGKAVKLIIVKINNEIFDVYLLSPYC